MTAHIDTYTKTVLTIIAACLLWMCVNSTAQPLHAQRTTEQYSPLPAQPVVVVGWGRLNPGVPGGMEIAWFDPVRKISEPAVPIRPAIDPKFEPLRVRVEVPTPLPVSLESVKRSGQWDALQTATDPDTGSARPGIRR
jgi:hypothetical protein